ncbi:hypothetical protein PUP68_16160 [Pseudomonas chlororaphis]|uniref:hypothetical protein n=1 Tax=Pseudomonas chlororaphis TaxID=587753 RepID=UPI00050D4CB6|nr:hypothetical protein [Pseudomonas chlororaphis]AIS13108.1 hypothetical protein JM49_16020 [Pseudomonas chlororaphis subsp. aurantiaca]AZC30971.1 Fap [Pseudomonas chlororaphis subsp. piscium]QTT89075.1 hypothetical protein HUT28_17395 [Pseudomonas chlororaphis]WDG78359.1 hypothetical protein PUP77_28700 [Pseudomonas chlororaphis]WDG88590.1 hypothetical protein PUP68_16160 [Pseudomonas chlororaphis]
MENLNSALTRLLLIGCAISSLLSLPVQAAGDIRDGRIVLDRDVQPHTVGRPPLHPDPYPTTVNANPSARVKQMTSNTELSDGDFAGVSSGSTISSSVMPNGVNLQGLNTVTNPNGMAGMSAGHGGGSGGAISGTINRSLNSGLAPLGRLAGGQ